MTANLVTSSRIVLALPLFALLMLGGPNGSWPAFAVFVLAGLTDVVDGRIARALNQVSALGAMLDLIADRLLTLTALLGLMAAGALAEPYGVVAGAVLIARDLIVASFGEAAPKGSLAVRVSLLEKIKITFQFAANGMLMAPPILPLGGLSQHVVGGCFLVVAAVLTLVTLADYATRAARAMRAP